MEIDSSVVSQAKLIDKTSNMGAVQKEQFEQLFNVAVQQQVSESQPNQIINALLNPLEKLNNQSQMLGIEALAASNNDVKPSQLLMLTMQTHEFMFQCQLTANVANRSSDGVQQLFRQQS